MLHYHQNDLFVEQCSLKNLATQFSTPCYIYSRTAIETKWQEFVDSFGDTPHQICYAVKANSNLAILNVFAKLGAGFDIVSQGELARVLQAGAVPNKIVFSGVGKTKAELLHAIEVGIHCINVESIAEIYALNEVAKHLQKSVAISLRINPNIDAKTHPYIATGLQDNKFGIDIATAQQAVELLKTMPLIKLIGVASHIGSQLVDLTPIRETIELLLTLYAKFSALGFPLSHINIGGGLGICYQDEQPPSINEYVSLVKTLSQNFSGKIFIEPGRVLTAEAGVLITKVEYLKITEHKNFAIVDAGMNDLIRPALYSAWHDIVPVEKSLESVKTKYDIVGPVCESADFIAKERFLSLKEGDYLAIKNVGAYGFGMSSNYNSRPRACEVLVAEDRSYLIRQRETIADLIKLESIID